MSEAESAEGAVVLDAGIFEDREALAAALLHLNITETDWYKLTPDTMNDSDWDNVLSLVLSAQRVITV